MTTFDVNHFADEIGGWDHKDGRAAEYESSDHNYRVWKPETVTSNADGTVFVGLKIDHIRGGGGDDHAFVRLTLAPSGGILNVSTETKFHDIPSFSKEFGGAAGAPWGPTGVAAGTAAATVLTELTGLYNNFSNDGGAQHLASIVQATIIRASNSVRP
jgi:hypothetical protein